MKFFGTYSLDKPIQVNFGPTIKEQGMLLEAEVGTGYPRDLPRPATRRDIFGDEAVAPSPAPFAKIAYVDSFDYPTVLETETAEGSRRILDIVLKTGATTVLWRNQSGAVPRYPSKEEALPLKEPPLDKRRIPLSEPIRGWTRFDDCGTDLIRAAADECAKRDVAFGIHLTTEENHGESWTLSPWNLEHPQFWSRRKNAAPWVGRCSHAFPEVRAHKLRLVDELLAYQPTMIYLDLCRSGGWTPSLEYVKPVVDAWQARYGAELPDWKDPRWLRLVEEMYEPYYRGIREHLDKTGRKVELVMAIERAGAQEDWNMVNRAMRFVDFPIEGPTASMIF